MDVWYNVAKVSSAPIDDVHRRFQVNGAENIISGPKIVVANHNYATDAFVVPFIFPEKLNFFVQSELFTLRFSVASWHWLTRSR